MIVKLSSKKWEYNRIPTCQLAHIQNCLLMSIGDTPRKYSSNVDRKSDMKKVCTFSVKSSFRLFYSSVCAMYNIVIFYQDQRLMLKSYHLI